MILHISPSAPEDALQQLQDKLKGYVVRGRDQTLLVTSSSTKTEEGLLSDSLQQYVQDRFVLPSDLQLGSRLYREKTRTVKIGNLVIGGDTAHTLMITGPCSAESESQMEEVCEFLKTRKVKVLRAGCFKPRTSPYSFQGLGREGLRLLVKMREKYGFRIITEVKDATHVDAVIAHADIVQIGAKAMYDHGILKACSKSSTPILIKRGFGSTLQEFVQAAEFVLSGGNEQVMLCERGIRTFETGTRFTLDLCGVSWLKEHTNLPVVLDPSHAMGYRYGVPDLTRACVAMGVDGLLIETHPNPAKARSDAAQQLNFKQFAELQDSLVPIAAAVGRKMI